MRRLQILSNSEEKTFRACQRKHHYAYRMLVRPVRKAKPLRYGSLFHHGLEMWWKTGGDIARAIEYAHAKASNETDDFEMASCDAVLLGYHARWCDEPYQPVLVEAVFEAPMVHPATGQVSDYWVHGGKVDVIALHTPSGEHHLIEHKSAGEDIRLGADYWKRLRLDTQVSKYFVGAAALGFDVTKCVYDVVRRPDQEPLKATPVDKRKYTKPKSKSEAPRLYGGQRELDETPAEYFDRIIAAFGEKPDYYFARGDVVRLDKDMREWAYDTWKIAQQIRDGERDEHYPKNPDACGLYHRTCEYMPICAGEAKPDDAGLFRRAGVKHEELEEESGGSL